MATAKNMKELEALINKKIAKALEKDVAEKVKDVMQEKVQTEVYDEYTSYSDHPDAYVRRGEHGGLKDRSNMESKVTDDNVLTIENVTRMENTGYMEAGLIEYGNNAGYGEYDYKPAKNSTGDFRQPRPFIEESMKILSDGVARESLKKGLQRQGLDIK